MLYNLERLVKVETQTKDEDHREKAAWKLYPYQEGEDLRCSLSQPPVIAV